MSQTTGPFRTEFALDGVWYTNALRFDTPEAAREEAEGRFMRWFGPVAWRVAHESVPMKQPYSGRQPATAFTIVLEEGLDP